MNFVLEKQLIKFSCTYQPLSICKIFIKKILELIQNYVRHFGTKTAHLSWTKLFWVKTIVITFIYLWPFSLWKIWKKSYNASRIMTMHHFWTQSGPFTSNIVFFRKPVNEPCFFYSHLSTCQKAKSDINLLVKYWWFKNTEISLAESHFCFYLRTRFFPSMQFSQDVNEP